MSEIVRRALQIPLAELQQEYKRIGYRIVLDVCGVLGVEEIAVWPEEPDAPAGGAGVISETLQGVAVPTPQAPAQAATVVVHPPAAVEKPANADKRVKWAGKKCSEPGCESLAFCKGLCKTHYWRKASEKKAKKIAALPVPTRPDAAVTTLKGRGEGSGAGGQALSSAPAVLAVRPRPALARSFDDDSIEALINRPIHYSTPSCNAGIPLAVQLKERKCLRCSKMFPSAGPGNRICPGCEGPNSRIGYQHEGVRD